MATWRNHKKSSESQLCYINMSHPYLTTLIIKKQNSIILKFRGFQILTSYNVNFLFLTNFSTFPNKNKDWTEPRFSNNFPILLSLSRFYPYFLHTIPAGLYQLPVSCIFCYEFLRIILRSCGKSRKFCIYFLHS